MIDSLRQFFPALEQNQATLWLLSFALAVALTILAKLGLRLLTSKLQLLAKRTGGRWDDLFVVCLESTKNWVLFLWFLWLSAELYLGHSTLGRTPHVVLTIATLFQILIWGFRGIHFWKDHILLRNASKDSSATAAVGLVSAALQGTFVIIILLIGLSNLGVNIGALLAGLGVGGIAIALAAQNVLGDLLASLSIVLDKPFVIGDNVSVGSDIGTVEYIGIKTTRMRSPTGEELIFANKDLLDSRIRNLTRMQQRRVIQRFGVSYSTPTEKLERIPSWADEITRKDPRLTFDRCHLAHLGESSINFEWNFLVNSPEVSLYMDLQQQMLLELLKKLQQEQVSLAFPTRTVILEKPATI